MFVYLNWKQTEIVWVDGVFDDHKAIIIPLNLHVTYE